MAFMGVNLAAIRQLYFKSPKKQRNLFRDLLIPGAGFIFCLWIWVSLPNSPKLLGGIWIFIGIIYLSLSTNWFKKQPVVLDFKDI